MKTEKEKMLAGELYDPKEAHLSAERRRARNLCKALNESGDEEQELRMRVIATCSEALARRFGSSLLSTVTTAPTRVGRQRVFQF